MELKGRVAVITGASRGIGRAIALKLAEAGVDVFLTARGRDALKRVGEECRAMGVKAVVFNGDLSDKLFIEKIHEEVLSELGSVDILINNAGKSPASNDPVSFKLEDWDNTLDLNFRSIYYLTKLLLPEIQKSSKAAIINVSSISATMTFKNGGIYCASKHALKAYSGCLFDNIRESGVKVCSILPGFVNTDMARGEGVDETLMIQPEDIADSVMYVLQSSKTVCPTEIKLRPQRSPYR